MQGYSNMKLGVWNQEFSVNIAEYKGVTGL